MSGPINDPTLGHLAWDKEFNWWTGAVELQPGQRVGLTVEADPAAPDQRQAVALARKWLDRLRENELDYTRWTAEHLLDVRWNKEQPMTLDDIIGLIELGSVECFPDGTANILWEDEDVLFFGHGILTNLDANGRCVRVEIQ
ncbi:MAG TPA: DUF2262 domain-containing protein [Gemmataceae bacterium]|nr:DUF2262 domain-containing protein [Gemmataceae bacterium]